MSDKKVCSRCSGEKEFDEFPLDKRLKCGHRAICKECTSKAAKHRYDPKYQHDWYLGHKEQHRMTGWLWRQENKERSRSYVKKWRVNNLEQDKGYAKKYYQQNKEMISEKYKKWASENKNIVCAISSKRRARKRNAPGNGISAKERADIFALYDHCLACGTKENLSLDHIVPLIAGGAHDISNAQVLCMPCNDGKGSKTIDYRSLADWT